MNSSDKFVIFTAFVCLLFIDHCYSSTFLTPPIEHPAFPGKCFEPSTKMTVEVGQTIDVPNGCFRLTCLQNFSFGGSSCPSIETADFNCQEVPGDKTASYPDCCPRFECNDLDEGSNEIGEASAK